jgi:predicted DsbA family dithiol-disulfide isomerase
VVAAARLNGGMTVIEVFADVNCPFTHVGLRRFVERRHQAGRDDVTLWVRAWPLELVNGEPTDPKLIAEEVDEIRGQLGDGVFTGFDPDAFPITSLDALALAAAAYRRDIATGEAVSLELRDLCFEQGRDIADAGILGAVADRHGISVTDADVEQVHADLTAGRAAGVIGSPHVFTPAGGFFCPALDVSRADDGRLRVHTDPDGFAAFVDACFAVR